MRWFILFWLLVSLQVAAQTPGDTTAIDSSAENYLDKPVFTEFTMANGFENYRPVDTAFQGIQRYHAAEQALFPAAYLSNIGSPVLSRWFQYTQQPGFRHGRNQFAAYQFQIDSLPFYRTTAPYTNIYFLLGQFTEQRFRLQHSQNFGPRANAAIDYERLVSVGYYQRERTAISNFSANGWWQNTNNRYRLYGALVYNDVRNQENGGIAPDSLFTTYLGPPAIAEPNLSNAQSDYVNYDAKLVQTYAFNRSAMVIPPGSDSAQRVEEPAVRLLHEIGAYNRRYRFEDISIDRSFYGILFEQEDTLRDVSELSGWYTGLSVLGVPGPKFGDSTKVPSWGWMVSTRLESARLTDQSLILLDRWHGTSTARLTYNPANLPAWGFFVESSADWIQADFLAKGGIRFHNHRFQAAVKAESGSVSQTLLQQYYQGFNERRAQELVDTRFQSLTIQTALMRHKVEVEAKAYLFNQYYFWNSQALPENVPGNVTLLQTFVAKTFTLGNFKWQQRIGFQQDNVAAIQLPSVLLDASVFYEGALFKRALLFQAGADTWWSSAYQVDAYNPVTGVFYFQNETTYNFYPVTDIFLNFDVRTFLFFVKMDNVTQGLFSKGYFEVPAYPMQNRSFKVGINWKIYY